VLIFTSILAFYLAWNLGANDVANSMGTSVGSKAVTLKQALIIAGVLEFTGAMLFGREVSSTLATRIVNPVLFAQNPQVLVVGMACVLVACSVWLNIATWNGLPVSSSHAVVGAIAGFACVAVGAQAVDWQWLGVISLTWVGTPLMSGAIAALLYGQIKRWILDQPDIMMQLREWIPWLSVALLGSFGTLVLPPLVETPFFEALPLPSHTIALTIGAIAAMGLTVVNWQQLESSKARRQVPDGWSSATKGPLVTTALSIALSESLFARLQLLSACFVAFAHGSNDVGNAVAPLAVIVAIIQTGTVSQAGFQVPLWILVLGGMGIVGGLAVWGKKVIATIGEGIIPLQPSGGFCAELATGTTILLASRLGLPVSTSHALIGSVVGIGLIQVMQSIRLSALVSIGLAWVVTIPIAAGLGAAIFFVSDWFLALD